ncbi:MAG: hypothetical protein AAGJ40_00800 [Planctomycetota bacterium]
MSADFTDAELLAFLDEELSEARSAQLEALVREDEGVRQRLVEIRGRSLAGLHTIGAIWRRNRLSCPDRAKLAAFLRGELDREETDWIVFHLGEIGCTVCLAQMDDLKTQAMPDPNASKRRDRMAQSSAGHLRS